MLNYPLYALRGSHPRLCGSPDAITPNLVQRHPRQRKGDMEGPAHVPSFIAPAS